MGNDLPWSARPGGLAVVPHRVRVVLLVALFLVAATWVQPAKSAAAGPVVTINSGPQDPIPTNVRTPTFDFSTNPPLVATQCRVDNDSYAPCASPFTTSPLTDGPHMFDVVASGTLGPVASRAFTVDTVPPETIITSGPPASSTDSTPTFAFAASEGGARFECSLDKTAFSTCTSPRTLGSLPAGAHSFAVRARDSAGNVDASPATLTFTIVAPAVNRPSPGGPDPVAVIATAFAEDLSNAAGQLRTSELPTLARARGITVRGIDPLVPGTARMTVTTRAGHPARRVGVLRGAKAFATARKGSLRLKPTRAGRRLLARASRMRLTVAYVFTARIGIRMSAAQQVTVWRRWLTLAEVARVARHWIYRYFGERARSLTLARCARRGPTFVRCSDVRWLNGGRWWHVRLRVRETASGFRQRMSDARSG